MVRGRRNTDRGVGRVWIRDGDFANPSGVAIATNGQILVADTVNHRIKSIAPSGEVRAVWGREGDAPGEFRYPRGVTTDPEGLVYVADFGNNRVQVFSPDGASSAHGDRPATALETSTGPWE